MSNTIRLNITLPTDLARKVKAAPNSSALVAAALRETFEREEKEKLNKSLIVAYADAAKEDREINEEWDVTIGDGL